MNQHQPVHIFSHDAVFSTCGKYRYQLHREWDSSLPIAMLIGLNPSTANADTNDPTIGRIITLMQTNGYGSFYMTNLFALISPYPEDLRRNMNPIADNDRYLEETRNVVDAVIFCWGRFPMAEYRAKAIIKMFPAALCFGKNKNGSPKHPLYLKSNTQLINF